jgi:hypothetical protein
MTHPPAEQEEEPVDIDLEFELTHQADEPVALLPQASPDHPTTILLRGDEDLPARWQNVPS